MDQMSLLNMGMSTLAGAASAALWVLQLREKQPQLSIYLDQLERLRFDAGPDEATWVVSVQFKLVVANNSTLPNAVLKARAWLRSREGAWLEGEPRLVEEAVGIDSLPGLPVNLASRTTAALRLHQCFVIPRPGGEEDCDDLTYFRRVTSRSPQLKVELTGLGGKTFRTLLAVEAQAEASRLRAVA